MLTLISKSDHIKIGKEITNNNQFFYTLHILLKCYFANQKDFYLMDFLKEVTKSEMEFKTFLVYKEYALHIYHTQLRQFLDDNDTIDDIVYVIIHNVKKTYDENHNVLKPFITSINSNEEQVIEMFNFIKSSYHFKIDALTKFNQLEQALLYLQKAESLKKEAENYSTMAIKLLSNIKENFGKTINAIDNMDIKLIKNV